MRISVLLFLLILSGGIFAQGSGEVIITEYHNRPLKPSEDQLAVALLNNLPGADTSPNEGHTEWFEIYNTTDAPVIMDGWTLTDASSSSNVSTIGTFTIEAKSYAAFTGFNIPDAQGGVVFDYIYDYKKPSFNNESSYADSGDTSCPDGVIIAKADGSLVDEVRYDYGYGEYIGNPSSGSCMENMSAIGLPPAGGSSKVSFMLSTNHDVMNSADNDLAENWSYSTILYDEAVSQRGTPGLPNDGSTPPEPSEAGSGEVIITEYHNRPQKPTEEQLAAALPNNMPGADTTPNEGHTEWFEVYNTTDSPVVMDGWTLTDASSSSNVSTIGSFTIEANSYAVFSGFNIPAAQGGVQFDYFYDYKKPSLNNESSYSDAGDTSCPDGVIIAKADGSLVDEVRYDYGYGEYLGNMDAANCFENDSAIGLPPMEGSSKVSFMLATDPAVMNADANDLAANWSYSTITYDDAGSQVGTPGLANDGSTPPVPEDAGTGEVIITEYYNRPLKPTDEQLAAALPNNPPGADTSPNEGHTEWFEVYNTTCDPVVMDGWTLTDASSSSNFSVIGSFTLEPYTYAVFSGFNIPEAQGGVVFDYFYDYKKPSFNNESSYADAGDTSCPDGVIITKADGTLVDEVRYDYGYGNYIGNDSAGSCRDNTSTFDIPPAGSSSKISFMLTVDPSKMNAFDNDASENWTFSTLFYDEEGSQRGTPGLANDGTDPGPIDEDQDGFATQCDCNDTNAGIYPGATEIPNNGIDEDCDGEDSMELIDADNDGFDSEIDCDDTNAEVNPDATEVPYNGLDDDCNPMTLDDDLDQDGFIEAVDCDDTDPTINPDEFDTPDNGIDEDCDGEDSTLIVDADSDGFGDDVDCDDTNAEVNPDAEEVPYNGIDDDCDPMTLDDDLDQDGFAQADDCDDTNAEVNPDTEEVPYNGIDDDCAAMTLDDDLDQDGFAQADDCDDANSEVNPDATEVPYNGVDDDCDAMTLDDDLDQDGFAQADDCDDSNSEINPDATEVVYNGIDDDCDPMTLDDDLDQDGFSIEIDCDDTDPSINPGATDIPDNGIDEDCTGDDSTDVVDTDGDGFGTDVDCDDSNPDVNPGATEILYNGLDDDCDPSTLDDDLDQDGFGADFDCDDSNADINPDATEIPYNGVDEDCNSMTLDDDLDQDGFAQADDCDDNNSEVNPDATEVPYNGIDDDCNSMTLDDDLDQDGFAQADDCDDNNSEVNPDATEVPYNGIDDDCNAMTLDDDLDQDGFAQADDCDDANSEVNPDATEVPYNGIDDDCNAMTLDDDLDQDGFAQADDCDDANSEVNPDATEVPYNGLDDDCNAMTLDDDLDQDGFAQADDCDDTNSEVNPDATEVPYNGLDDDCDETTLDDDLDQDGFAQADDCDDTNAAVNPDADEVPYNGLDDDCNEATFDDDLDQDGFLLADDCDDDNPGINPDAEEIANNGIDEDCDGEDLLSGLHELSNATINIFPNPILDVINIQIDGSLDYKATLYDLDGRLISSLQNATSIDVYSLHDGIYLLEVQDLNTGKTIIEKLIKE